MSQKIYKFGYGKADGDGSMASVLGGKGAGLAEMSKMGITVPPGFTIPTSVCLEYEAKGADLMGAIKDEVVDAYYHLLDGFPYGAQLMVSVRSGAPVSMPGMMDTILNVGMCSKTFDFWNKKLGNRAALDCHRRLIQMLGCTAYGIEKEVFENLLTSARTLAKVSEDRELSEHYLSSLVGSYREAFKEHAKMEFPDTIEEQLMVAVEAVFKSWHNPRAVTYRDQFNIDHKMGTAVTVQAMVFGNLNDNSGSGVLFTRDPSTGTRAILGEFLPNAQGEDVVAGIRTPMKLTELNSMWPNVGAQIVDVCDKLETHYKDMMDVEFTVQDGQLYLLQCRVGKRSPLAMLVIAASLVKEDRITIKEALARLTRKNVRDVLQPGVDLKFTLAPAFVGTGACVGVAKGVVVLTAAEAVESEVPCILVRYETDPNDISGMVAAQGILTRTGGSTCHAAVVARALNKPCVVGCTSLGDDIARLAGKTVTIDGDTGRVWVDADVPVLDNGSCWPIKFFGVQLAAKSEILDAEVSDLEYLTQHDGNKKFVIQDFKSLLQEDSVSLQGSLSNCTVNTVVGVYKEDETLEDLLGPAKRDWFEPNPQTAQRLFSLRKQKCNFYLDGDAAKYVESLAPKCERVSFRPRTLSELLDQKQLDPSDELLTSLGSDAWNKLMPILKGSGFVDPSHTRVPLVYTLMRELKEG